MLYQKLAINYFPFKTYVVTKEGGYSWPILKHSIWHGTYQGPIKVGFKLPIHSYYFNKAFGKPIGLEPIKATLFPWIKELGLAFILKTWFDLLRVFPKLLLWNLFLIKARKFLYPSILKCTNLALLR